MSRRPTWRARSAMVEGELVAAIGENRKMVIFPLDQVPEMARGRGVRLQRYKDGGLVGPQDLQGDDGLSWTDAAGRAFSLTLKELADWRGNRADAGRLAPEGFPAQQHVQPAAGEREGAGGEITRRYLSRSDTLFNSFSALALVLRAGRSRRRAPRGTASIASCPAQQRPAQP